jgi:hypothetical protein
MGLTLGGLFGWVAPKQTTNNNTVASPTTAGSDLQHFDIHGSRKRAHRDQRDRAASASTSTGSATSPGVIVETGNTPAGNALLGWRSLPPRSRAAPVASSPFVERQHLSLPRPLPTASPLRRNPLRPIRRRQLRSRQL